MKSFFNYRVIGCLAGIMILVGPSAFAAGNGSGALPAPLPLIAVLPVINLSGAPAPVKQVRQALLSELTRRGIAVLEEEPLEQFMARHRIRYAGGMDERTAEALKEETGVEEVLVTTLELYSTVYPPKIVLDLRLVSTGARPKIVWADAAALAGDDAAGLFGRGVIDTVDLLGAKALRQLVDSLVSGMTATGVRLPAEKVAGRYLPRIAFRSPALESGRSQRVAILPFVNRSERKNAGEIIALHFARELARSGKVNVVEPGVVRQKLLAYRIIMEEGLSLANAGIIFEVLDVDLILTGDVMEYDDYEGSTGVPQVAFSARLFDRENRKVVGAALSRNQGDDGSYFFEIGKRRTAHRLASDMVRGAVSRLLRTPADSASQRGPARAGTGAGAHIKEGEL